MAAMTAVERKRRSRAKLAPDKPRFESGPSDVCDWIEWALVVPSGPLAGKPFKLGGWQRRFIKGLLQDEISEAGLSVGRKNGKSGLIAALILAYICGPLRSPADRRPHI